MSQTYFTIQPRDIHSVARSALKRSLPWHNYGKLVTVQKLLDLLLLTSLLSWSISATARRLRFGFSHETARGALHDNLHGLDQLTHGLVDALYMFGSRHLRRRLWVVAIDEHRCPFYGDRSTPGVTGGPKKQGTKYAYGYATAALVHHRHRFTVGLVALTESVGPHEVVAALLAQMHARGLKIRGVVLDSGFDSGEVLLSLQERGLSYTVPLRRKGNKRNRRNAIWDLDVGTVSEVCWRTDKTRKQVSTQALVWQLPREKRKKVFAFGGWDEAQARSQIRRARLAKRWYRKRFGIETSYRQMRQCQARTTKKDIRYRLLLIGIALLLRQVWVWLTRHLAEGQRLRPTQWVGEMPLEVMATWLADLLKSKYKPPKEIPISRPLPSLEGS
jgi:hypothetical protein